DPYEFIPPELDRKLRQEKEVPADEALERAAVMLGEKRGRQYLMRRILSEDVIIGYELIPRDSYPAPRAVTNLLRIEYHV
ncbi:MAG: hypothetical protein GWO24_03390, partial [Akkermansiaceae bacterium]|nr:hypothetical protein [Akkermansiaceae bacterium]